MAGDGPYLNAFSGPLAGSWTRIETAGTRGSTHMGSQYGRQGFARYTTTLTPIFVFQIGLSPLNFRLTWSWFSFADLGSELVQSINMMSWLFPISQLRYLALHILGTFLSPSRPDMDNCLVLLQCLLVLVFVDARHMTNTAIYLSAPCTAGS